MDPVNTIKHNMVIAGFILGICSCLCALLGAGALLGVAFGIVGLVFSVKCANAGNNEGLNKASKVLNIVGICISGAVILCIFVFTGCAALMYTI